LHEAQQITAKLFPGNPIYYCISVTEQTRETI